MRVEINGAARQIESTDLAALLVELQRPARGIATALNGAFVPAAARTSTPIHEGDQIEILAPMQGG